jgi:hypothetical protein
MSALHILVTCCGAAAEGIGFVLVLREARRLRRDELNDIGALERFKQSVKATIRNPTPADLGTLTAGGASAAQAEVTVPGPESLHDEMRRRYCELDERLVATRQEVDALRSQLNAREVKLTKQEREREQEHKQDIDRATRNERRGAYVFLLGVALNLVAALIS